MWSWCQIAERCSHQKVAEDPMPELRGGRCGEATRALPVNDDRIGKERAGSPWARRQQASCRPRVDMDHRPQVPSFYRLEVLRAAEGAARFDRWRGAEQGGAARIVGQRRTKPTRSTTRADLALLEELFRLPRSRDGTTRYLLANPHLARARFRAQRWEVPHSRARTGS
jgi:hypothetical protein